jgi:two-component system nitrate/nitrite response regulator NarL
MRRPIEPAGPVLVVDDDDKLLAFVSGVLERGGYRTCPVRSGEEALEAAHIEQPILVVVDIRLPGMSGYEVCRILRAAHGAQLPIIFISGERTEPFDRAAGLRLGADDYIVKPFDPDELLARVDRLVRVDSSFQAQDAELTKRELDVLELLVDGLRPKEIAKELSISVKTVGTHIQNILPKLGVHSQGHAVAVAVEKGMLKRSPGLNAKPA